MGNTNEPAAVPFLVIKYEGRIANNGALPLDQFTKSLAGWQQLLEIAIDVVLRADVSTAHLKASDVIRIDAVGERKGSYEFWLGYGTGVAQNATWDAIKCVPRVVQFLAKLVRTHAEVKKVTYDVDRIVAALDSMVAEEGLTPVAMPLIGDQMYIAQSDGIYDIAEDQDPLPDPPAKRSMADKIDQSLKDAASPIGAGCNTVELREKFSDVPILHLDYEDKLAIDAPLVALPSEMNWRRAKIKFVRINRKTGRALFYFANDPEGENNTHYSVIADDYLRHPESPYTDAFNRDAELDVLVRHTAGEKGSIRTLWEIAIEPAAELF